MEPVREVHKVSVAFTFRQDSYDFELKFDKHLLGKVTRNIPIHQCDSDPVNNRGFDLESLRHALPHRRAWQRRAQAQPARGVDLDEVGARVRTVPATKEEHPGTLRVEQRGAVFPGARAL